MFKVSPIRLLGQTRPGNTTAAAGYTAVVQTEITSVLVCNTSSSSAKFRLFHDEGGSSYDQTNALFYDAVIAAGQTVSIHAEEHGLGLEAADTLGVRTDTASALTFSIYGRKVLSRRED